MKDMFNNWRKDVGEWMHEHNRKEYEYLKSGDKKSSAHDLGKKAFNKYLFQLCGDKFLLRKLIQLPLERAAHQEQKSLKLWLVPCLYRFQRKRKKGHQRSRS